ncbi:MAG: 3-isopropylmalate dehydratase [Burkholderiaceae bacterium]
MTLTSILGPVAHVFPDDYDVDQIVGVKNIKVQDVDRLAELALDQLGPGFREHLRPGGLLVAGANFGYGHPHFPAMRAMRKLGIRAVVAESFFPVYWRGELSNGFPQVACAGIRQLVAPGDPIEIDFAAGAVRLPVRELALPFEPLAASEVAMLEAGGFRTWLAQSLAAERREVDVKEAPR